MVSIVSIPVQAISVAQVHESPLNPRRHFDKKKLGELAANMRDVGQLEAITVRPRAGHAGEFELVNGARRWHAAPLAGLETLAARVCEMTDAEALAVMLTTGSEGNVEQLTPLEEGEGYQKLREIESLSLEQVAARVGRSPFYIRSRVDLLGLPEAARVALDKGELPKRTAWEIARIPSEDKRAEAAAAVLRGGVGGGVMPALTAKLYIEQHICRTLRGAPFNVEDPALLPEAGPCALYDAEQGGKGEAKLVGGCPFLAGNNPELYGDVKNRDTCMHPSCFERKVAAVRARVLAREAKEGKEPLPAEVNATVFPPTEAGLSWNSEYVAWTQPITRDLLKDEVTRVPTWAALCEGQGVTVYVGIDQAGRAVDVAKCDEALAAVPEDELAIFADQIIRKHGLRSARRGAKGSIAEEEERERLLREKAERQARRRQKKAREWLEELAARLETMAAGGEPAWSGYLYWSLMAELGLRGIGAEEAALVCEAFGVEIAAEATAHESLSGVLAAGSKERIAALVTALTLAPWLRAEGPEATFVTSWHEAFLAGK